MPKKIALVTDELYLGHHPGEEHPENPQRIKWLMEGLKVSELLNSLDLVRPQELPEEVLVNYHSREYLESLKAKALAGGGQLDEDTLMVGDSFLVAKRSVEGVYTAFQKVMAKEYSQSIALVRPPGHHALSNKAKGFCIFNNIAVAVKELQKTLEKTGEKLERILILDWDAHHGNGLQDAFYQDPGVLYISIHQDGIFPYTGWSTDCGEGQGLGKNVNIPIPRFTGDAGYYYLFNQLVIPIIKEYQPQLVIVAAGFDGHFADPMSTLEITALGYGKMMEMLKSATDEYTEGKLVMVLEGGYQEESLVSSFNNVVRAMLEGRELERDFLSPPPNIMRPQSRERIDDAISIQRKFWKI